MPTVTCLPVALRWGAVTRGTDHRHVPLQVLERFGTTTATGMLRPATMWPASALVAVDDGEPLGRANLRHALARCADRNVLYGLGDTGIGLDGCGEAGVSRHERQADGRLHVDDDATSVGDRLQRLLLVRGVEGDDVLAAGVVLLLGCGRSGVGSGVGASDRDHSGRRRERGERHQPVMSHGRLLLVSGLPDESSARGHCIP